MEKLKSKKVIIAIALVVVAIIAVVLITNGNKTETPTTTESTTKPEELIKTGQLNWPVPIFTIVGLLLFSTGWAMLNLGKKEEEIV